jgi:hypothetical protein
MASSNSTTLISPPFTRYSILAGVVELTDESIVCIAGVRGGCSCARIVSVTRSAAVRSAAFAISYRLWNLVNHSLSLAVRFQTCHFVVTEDGTLVPMHVGDICLT